jgi:hypothetical protein
VPSAILARHIQDLSVITLYFYQMKQFYLAISIILGCLSVESTAQSFYFGPKAGLSIAYQQWNQNDRSPILTLHGDLFVETTDFDGRGSLYGQLGFHTRGSGIRVRNILNNNVGNQQFKFNNISLGVGIKKRLDIDASPVYYYMAGIRLEYTISNNLTEIGSNQFTGGFLFDPYVRDFNYGITVGGGIEFQAFYSVVPFIEFSFMPDLSKQYDQFESVQFQDPVTNNFVTFGAKSIRNLSLEVTLGVKLFREVIYVD